MEDDGRGGQLRNQDALSHLENASIKADYSVINPFCFEPAIAPHIAAENIGQTMTIETLTEGLQPAFKIAADFKLIEGAGGWYVPLNTNETYADWVTTLKLPVIVVVGIKLGAINHALLTLECIHRSHLDVVGWVGNCIDPDMLNMDETIVFLRTHIHAPCLGIVPFLSSPHAEKVAKYLSLPSMS